MDADGENIRQFSILEPRLKLSKRTRQHGSPIPRLPPPNVILRKEDTYTITSVIQVLKPRQS